MIVAIIATIRWLIHRKSPNEKPAKAELQTHEEEAQPRFSWTHAAKDPRGGVTRQFRNDGGEVSILLVETTAAVRVEWHPKGSLSSHDQGWVRFTSKTNEVQLPITWTINYGTALGPAVKQVFNLTTAEGQPELMV